MADDTIHPRPDQSEEPVEDIGASNVDLDEERHAATHESPADPEPDHQAEDDHDDGHSTDDPKWVLAPLVIGLVIGLVVVIALGLASDASPFHQL